MKRHFEDNRSSVPQSPATHRRTGLPGRNLALLLAFQLALLPGLSGCGAEKPIPPPGPAPQPVVLIDKQTGDLFVGEPGTGIPAVHPRTGKPTLIAAMYCAQCQRWYPVPPPEAQRRIPAGRLCPKHQTALEPNGPIPEKSTRLAP
jgi:hypothetical protein